MTVKEAIQRYWQQLESLGQTSFREHSTPWLRRFLEYCHSRDATELTALNASLLRDFRQHLTWTPGPKGSLYSQHTIFQAQRMVRSFVSWLHLEELLFENLAQDWRLRHPPQVPRDVPTVEALSKLFAVPNNRNRKGSLRRRAILELFYGTGIRLSECHALDLDSLDLEASRLHVQGKGSKERALPIGANLRQTLRRYLDVRNRFHPADDEKALFVNIQGGRFSKHCIQALVSDTAKKAGLGGFGPHTLRHAFAIHLLEAGADLAYIQTLLGHESMETTKIYTQIRPLEMMREHQRTHPRATRKGSKPKRAK